MYLAQSSFKIAAPPSVLPVSASLILTITSPCRVCASLSSIVSTVFDDVHGNLTGDTLSADIVSLDIVDRLWIRQPPFRNGTGAGPRILSGKRSFGLWSSRTSRKPFLSGLRRPSSNLLRWPFSSSNHHRPTSSQPDTSYSDHKC
ncbi:hypothetical protein BD310DRAFT_8078 [Dichomitus squalens]|uniref:Uncharacterized protein n=1 Tax=Dichomitus squalens TaxID=114155 RepID=A0A4Q9QF13_9APHY|nr:hypothetical protein BD310DRAFT_8078 [Dichomitus squalens]